MKLLPLQLPPGAGTDRFTMPLGPFSAASAAADILLWRYHAAATGMPAFPGTPPHTRLQAPPHPAQQPQHAPPESPTHQPLSPVDFKPHLPMGMESDPRAWSREDVGTFLRWCEKEFDLPRFDMDMFQMNGKAMCLLTKGDLSERAPGAGDVIHNALRLLLSRNQPSTPTALNLPSPQASQHPPTTPTSLHHPMMHPHPYHHLPSSPVTPTSATASYLPPTSTPTSAPSAAAAAASWSLLAAAAASSSATPSAAATSSASSRVVDDFHSYGHHFMHQGNSVTLSPAPSIDSQSGSSPTQTEVYNNGQQHGYGIHPNSVTRGSAGTGSGPSDSEEGDDDAFPGSAPERASSPEGSHPRVVPPPPPASHLPPSPSTKAPPPMRSREVVQTSSETPEPNTNGRLLWDFLQQLLNDPPQRYGHFITWKNRETGVFKIVDPPGLAKLWGIQKNHLSMNYDKMSRALRYYYRVNILRKVQGERHCYQFLRNPSELKNIKNISLLRQQVVNGNSSSAMSDGSACHIGGVTITMKQEAPESPEQHNSQVTEEDEEEMATDLSLGGVDPLLPTDLSVGVGSSRSSPSSGALSSDDESRGGTAVDSRGTKRGEPYLQNSSEMKSISLRRQKLVNGSIKDGKACHIGGVTITVKQEAPESPEHHMAEENEEVMATDLSVSGVDTDPSVAPGGHSLYNGEGTNAIVHGIKRSDSDVE